MKWLTLNFAIVIYCISNDLECFSLQNKKVRLTVKYFGLKRIYNNIKLDFKQKFVLCYLVATFYLLFWILVLWFLDVWILDQWFLDLWILDLWFQDLWILDLWILYQWFLDLWLLDIQHLHMWPLYLLPSIYGLLTFGPCSWTCGAYNCDL